MEKENNSGIATNKLRIATKLALFIAISFIFVAVNGTKAARAASLYFSPSWGNFFQDRNFTVSILVNTDQTINAISGTLNFPSEYMEVLAVNGTNSIINLWVQTPSFSDRSDLGNVRFEGIILNPGYLGSSGRIIDIVFKAKKVGMAKLTFSELAVLANDGKGTNIVSSGESAIFTIVKPSPVPQENNSSSLNLENKFNEIEEKINQITNFLPQAPTIVVQSSNQLRSNLEFWEILPKWTKISILFTIGIATLILLFILVSFAVITLIWFCGFIWHTVIKKIGSYLRWGKKEMEGDIAYSLHEFKEGFQNIKKAPSFNAVFTNYWSMVGRIIKRFFTKNENDPAEETENMNGCEDGKKKIK